MKTKRIVIGTVLFLGVAGVIYLATLGCCHLIGSCRAAKPVLLSEQLGLTASQRQEIASLEKNFMAQKEASCQLLCAKRAQIIQILKQPDPDQGVLHNLVQEVGQEQMILEKATVDHLLAVREHLEPAQRQKLVDLMSSQLRAACQATACGTTSGCSVTESTSSK